MSSAAPKLLRSAPYLPVADLAAAAAHYVTVLGFRQDYLGGSPAHFAILSRDGLTLMLRLVADASKIRPNESQGGTWDVFYWVSDADGLYEEFRSRDADIVYEPTIQTEYAMKEFAVRDLDGHVLGFGQDISESTAG